MRENKVGAVIQARMSSSRLPGKVLLPICDRPMLFYLVDRLRWSSEIAEIVVATSLNSRDDSIEGFCHAEGLKCFRGSEDDVLSRVFGAAEQFNFGQVLRLTGDCPLIDPYILDEQVRYFSSQLLDYCYLGQSYPEGICSDLISFSALTIAHNYAREEFEREHVTPYFHARREEFKVVGIENASDYSTYRFVVDEPVDFEVVSRIIEKLYEPYAKPFTMADIKKFIDDHPEIFQLNHHIVRNEKYDVFAEEL